MNRCLTGPVAHLLKTLPLLLLWTASVLPTPAGAQTAVRQFPATAKRGTLVVTAPPAVLINGNAERLSPGARIKSETNMMLMSAALVGSPVVVNYRRDAQGLIHEVWILSALEAQEKREGMDTSNIVFDSVTQQTKTDDGKTPFNQLPKYGEK